MKTTLTLICTLFTFLAIGQQLQYATPKTILNVRNAPNKDGKIVDYLEKGQRIEVKKKVGKPFKTNLDEYCCIGNYVQIVYKNKKGRKASGYVFDYYLQMVKPLYIGDTSNYNNSEKYLLPLLRQMDTKMALITTTKTEFSDYEHFFDIVRVDMTLYHQLKLDKLAPYDTAAVKMTRKDEGRNELEHTINGTIDINDNVMGIVVGFDYYNEYSEYLVTYNLKGDFIDALEIASGDMVESFTYVESEFVGYGIKVIDYLMTDEYNEFDHNIYKPTKEKIYKIKKSGHFSE